MRRRFTDDDDNSSSDKVIDLLSTLKDAQDESKTYICSECGSDLVLDKTYRLRNPYGGEGFFCSNVNKCSMFGRIQDVSFVKPKIKPRPVRGAISNPRDASQEVMFSFVDEDKGLELERDSYEKYDPEPGDDERMKMQGFHIISSEIQLTDSSGQMRAVVNRNQM